MRTTKRHTTPRAVGVRPWFVFFGTATAVVWATDQERARIAFLSEFDPERWNARWRGVTPPAQDEMRIRPPCAADRDWIEQSDDPAFVEALAHADGPQ